MFGWKFFEQKEGACPPKTESFSFALTDWPRWGVNGLSIVSSWTQLHWQQWKRKWRKKCYLIQRECKNKEIVNWPGRHFSWELKGKFQSSQWVKKKKNHLFLKQSWQGLLGEQTRGLSIPAHLSPGAPNQKSTWPGSGAFAADVEAWNSAWGWSLDKAWWQYSLAEGQDAWGTRSGQVSWGSVGGYCMCLTAGRLWKSIQMPPSIKGDKGQAAGEVNPWSFICLCILLESSLLL